MKCNDFCDGPSFSFGSFTPRNCRVASRLSRELSRPCISNVFKYEKTYLRTVRLHGPSYMVQNTSSFENAYQGFSHPVSMVEWNLIYEITINCGIIPTEPKVPKESKVPKEPKRNLK